MLRIEIGKDNATDDAYSINNRKTLVVCNRVPIVSSYTPNNRPYIEYTIHSQSHIKEIHYPLNISLVQIVELYQNN
jgi:hypothetical protein